MIFLHPNLSGLSKLAANDAGRYAMQGVLVSETKTGYRAVTTDGKRLGIVDGLNALTVLAAPIAALDSAPNGEASAIIPTKDFVAAMKAAPKDKHGISQHGVAAVFGKDVSTLASTTRETANVSTPRNVEGQFPDVMQVIPGDAPAASVQVNAKSLAELLTVAASYSQEESTRCAPNVVTLELRGVSTPIVVRAANGMQTFTGVITPINYDHKAKYSGKGKQPATAQLAKLSGRNRDAYVALSALAGSVDAVTAVEVKRIMGILWEATDEVCEKAA